MAIAADKILAVESICIPDGKLTREITQLVRDTEPAQLFHHSSRVYYWAEFAGTRRGLKFDGEFLYAGAMFHDMGLTPAHSSAHDHFEVDGANVAGDFLRSHGISERDIDLDGDRPAHDAGHPVAHAPRLRPGDGGGRDGRAGAELLNTVMQCVKRSCTRIRAPTISRRTSSRRHQAQAQYDIQQRPCWQTKTRLSGVAISAA